MAYISMAYIARLLHVRLLVKVAVCDMPRVDWLLLLLLHLLSTAVSQFRGAVPHHSAARTRARARYSMHG